MPSTDVMKCYARDPNPILLTLTFLQQFRSNSLWSVVTEESEQRATAHAGDRSGSGLSPHGEAAKKTFGPMPGLLQYGCLHLKDPEN